MFRHLEAPVKIFQFFKNLGGGGSFFAKSEKIQKQLRIMMPNEYLMKVFMREFLCLGNQLQRRKQNFL